jgi:poly-gamma-glutamate synthesis protein (capsule biosynthesis protein)
MVPIVAYGWDDVRSMLGNNSSGFNYRFIAGTDRPSQHAYGLAFDLNPLWNPCCSDGFWAPDAPYVPEAPGTIARRSWVVRVFEDLDFKWGGDWSEPFDPQHFQMRLDQI